MSGLRVPNILLYFCEVRSVRDSYYTSMGSDEVGTDLPPFLDESHHFSLVPLALAIRFLYEWSGT